MSDDEARRYATHVEGQETGDARSVSDRVDLSGTKPENPLDSFARPMAAAGRVYAPVAHTSKGDAGMPCYYDGVGEKRGQQHPHR